MGVADEPTDDEAPPTAPTSCDEPGCVFVTTVPSSFSAELPVTGWPTINWPAINWAVILPHQVAAPAELNELAGLRAFGADSMRSHLALGVLRI